MQVREETRLYTGSGDSVVVVVHLDEVVGLADTISTSTSTSTGRDGNDAVAQRSSSGQRSITLSVMRPAVFHQTILLGQHCVELNAFLAGDCEDGTTSNPVGRVSFCVVSQSDDLLELFRKRSSFGPSVVADSWQLSSSELPAGADIINGRTLSVLTAGYKCALATEGLTRGRHYWTVRLDRVRGATTEIYVGVVQPEARGSAFNRVGAWSVVNGTQPVVAIQGNGSVVTTLGPVRAAAFPAFEEGMEIGFLLDFENHGMLAAYINGDFAGIVAFGIKADADGGPVYPAVLSNVISKLTFTPRPTAPGFFPDEPKLPAALIWDTHRCAFNGNGREAFMAINGHWRTLVTTSGFQADAGLFAFEIDVMKTGNNHYALGITGASFVEERRVFVNSSIHPQTVAGAGLYTHGCTLDPTRANTYEGFATLNGYVNVNHRFTIGIAVDATQRVMQWWLRRGDRGSIAHSNAEALGELPATQTFWDESTFYPTVVMHALNDGARIVAVSPDDIPGNVAAQFV